MNLKIDSQTELSQIKKEDASELFHLVDQNRAYLRQWLGWLDITQSVKDSEGFIEGTLKSISERKVLCCLLRVDNKIVGIIDMHLNSANKSGAIGYWISEDQRGKALAKRASKAMVDYAFKELKLNRVDIRCATENTASQSVPKGLGFKQVGILPDNEWLYDHYVDHVVYSVLARDWKN